MLLAAMAAMGILNAPCVGQTTEQRPNVLVLLADDQGWGDLSLNGNSNLATPNIDSLAKDGASFRHFYVCQVCAPTRAEFLTGRYYPRTGVSGVTRGEERLNADETTIAQVFQKAGYATGCFGKWHNGTQPPYHPNFRGFDEFYGFTSGHWGHYFSPPLDKNGQRVRGKGFLPDDLTSHALEFIRANRERPFFCYVPFNTPHSPMMVPDRFYEKFDGAEMKMQHRDPKLEDVMMTRAALALCENLDWNVGRLLRGLDELGLRERTIVVYFSDNGPNSYRWNGGMKGRKGSLDEGGVRSPCLVRWPGRVAAGAELKSIAGAIDLLPTLAELASVSLNVAKPLDGISTASWLTGGDAGGNADRVIYSCKVGKPGGRPQVSVRSQRFRLDATSRVFDVNADPGQRHDVSAEHPDEARQLTKLAREHGEQMAIAFSRNLDRPFPVGYAEATMLPARDGEPHGGIQRSSKAPNNSFFTKWSSREGYITWDVDVQRSGVYEVVVRYTCPPGNVGARVRIGCGDAEPAEATVETAFDPPLYDKSKERVADSHYFVKDFRPLTLGKLQLSEGRGQLKLDATHAPGPGVIDVHSIDLNFVSPARK
ncbi:MAG: sulfatase-like hydrolase/transferase [Planctomycetales bacterium]|nr:sulfatase-like hydrolase/transferase [Planctomycetales bacterium]